MCAVGALLLWGIYNVPPDEPPDAFGVGPMQLIPVAFILIVVTAIWLVAAVTRLVVVLARMTGILRARTSNGDITHP